MCSSANQRSKSLFFLLVVFSLAVSIAAFTYFYSCDGYPDDTWPCKIVYKGPMVRETVYKTLPEREKLQMDNREEVDTTVLEIEEVKMTISEKEKFQQNQVNLFCEKYNLNDKQTPYNLSKDVYHQLLVSKDTGTLFCFVPKGGCTSLKVMFFIAQELIPNSMAEGKNKKGISDTILKDLVAKNSLQSYDKESSTIALSTYYKFVMYRNPLERLVSAYRSKVERHPLQGFKDDLPHYNWLRNNVFNYTHPHEHKIWVRDGGKTPVDITFPDFVSYWSDTDDYRTRKNPHFMPIFELCEPCRVRYDYYGNFAMFDQDAEILATKIHTTTDFLRQSYYDTAPKLDTRELTGKYFKQLSMEQKKGVLKRLAVDLDFYYHLFPAERNIQERIFNLPTSYV